MDNRVIAGIVAAVVVVIAVIGWTGGWFAGDTQEPATPTTGQQAPK
jgi:hypothetical protein